jgi:hypothetical protein
MDAEILACNWWQPLIYPISKVWKHAFDILILIISMTPIEFQNAKKFLHEQRNSI